MSIERVSSPAGFNFLRILFHQQIHSRQVLIRTIKLTSIVKPTVLATVNGTHTNDGSLQQFQYDRNFTNAA